MKNNQWQNHLHKRMAAHSEVPPDDLWADIEHAISKKPDRKKGFWWHNPLTKIAAVALVALLAGVYIVTEKSGVSAEQEPVIVEQEPTPDKKSLPEKPSLLPPEEKTAEITHEAIAIRRKNSKNTHSNTIDSNSVTSYTSTISAFGSPEKISQVTISSVDTILPSEVIVGSIPTEKTLGELLAESESDGTQTPKANWQTNVFVANAVASAGKEQHGFASLYNDFSPMAKTNAASNEPALYNEILLQNTPEETNTQTKHSQPVTAGISLRYPLANRWYISSGITYTLLSSDLHSGTDGYYYNSEQKLYYVGIPISVDYSLWKNSKWSAYLSSGIHVEKNIAGKLITRHYIGSEAISQTYERISVKPLQWSAAAAFGIEYRLFGNVSLYGEPGVSYHFPNKSSVETIYKEKPVNINLRAGLRFTF
ncbi:MAG: porin family protein [Capnocytophaga sp.]|nr:porin family protein [Capnocytophaga sp.]